MKSDQLQRSKDGLIDRAALHKITSAERLDACVPLGNHRRVFGRSSFRNFLQDFGIRVLDEFTHGERNRVVLVEVTGGTKEAADGRAHGVLGAFARAAFAVSVPRDTDKVRFFRTGNPFIEFTIAVNFEGHRQALEDRRLYVGKETTFSAAGQAGETGVVLKTTEGFAHLFQNFLEIKNCFDDIHK